MCLTYLDFSQFLLFVEGNLLFDVIVHLVGKKFNYTYKTLEYIFAISRYDNPKLDFKRQWYKEADVKTELIKDIIALANGNIHTIGQNSFLIIV